MRDRWKSWLVLFILVLAWAQPSLARVPEACANKAASLSTQSLEIEAFLAEFNAGLLSIDREKWHHIMGQIRKINFNSEPHPKIEVFVFDFDRNARVFEVDPSLVQGWRDLGFITEDGRFNFQAKSADVARRLAELSGLKVGLHFETYQIDSRVSVLMPHSEFVARLARGEIELGEFHDFIFHAPFLLNETKRRLAIYAARYDHLMEQDGRESILNALFEYHANAGLKYLRGPFQLTREYTPRRPQVFRASFNYFRLSFLRYLSEQEALWQAGSTEGLEGNYTAFVWHYGVKENEFESWYIAVLAMRAELRRSLAYEFMQDEDLAEARRLDQDLAKMLEELKDLI